MTISDYSDSLEWVISMGIHIKSDKLGRNGWKWHILAINSGSNQNQHIKRLDLKLENSMYKRQDCFQLELLSKVLKLNIKNSIF